MGGLILPFSGSAKAIDPNSVFEIQSVGDGIAIKGESEGGGTAILAYGGSDQGGYGGIGLQANSVNGGTAVQARNAGVDRDGNPGWAVEAIAEQGGVAVVARTSGTDRALSDAGNWGNAGLGVDSTCDSGGIGVRGQSSGKDPDGNAGPGIMGSSEYGVGVRAASGHNFAIQADGNASQALGAGGWVKALVQIASGKLNRYFNSQPGLPPPDVYQLDAGLYSIDFHFDVSHRYVAVTPVTGNYEKAGESLELNPFAPTWYPPSSASTLQTKFLVANIVFVGFTSPPSYSTPPPGVRKPETTMITVMTFQPVFINAGGGVLVFQGFKLQDSTVCVAVF